MKLAYIGLQIATIALGIWKVNGMGLLPYVSFPLVCGVGGAACPYIVLGIANTS